MISLAMMISNGGTCKWFAGSQFKLGKLSSKLSQTEGEGDRQTDRQTDREGELQWAQIEREIEIERKWAIT